MTTVIDNHCEVCTLKCCFGLREAQQKKIDLLREALHLISLAAQTSMTTKKDMGVDARRALEATK